MRNLYNYVDKCVDMLDRLNIPFSECVTFEINTRAKKRWGRCTKTMNGYFTIQINVELLKEENKEEALINTIIHEFLHTCEGCMNHGKKWKRYAQMVNDAYGYNITRCSSAEEKGVVTMPIHEIEYRYVIKCKCCGQTIRRTKMSKVIKHPNFYRCGRCGGGFERII